METIVHETGPARHAASRGRSPEEWQIRVDLAAAYRLVAHFGWDDLIFTHLSARVPGPDHHFLINPYGLLFSEITASSLVKIDLDGESVEPTPHRVNPAGFTIHSAIHAAREDALCVVHLHTVAGVAVASQEAGLLPLNQTAMVFNNQLAVHEYEGLALDLDERARLVRDLGANRAMLLRNHGTLTLGASVAAAFLRMYFLERACAMQVAATSGGTALHLPQERVHGVVEEQVRMLDDLADELVWPALLRMLDAKDPSFRT